MDLADGQVETWLVQHVTASDVPPDDAEGTIFALITTWQNLAGEVGYDFGTLLECVWPVKNEELKDHQWQNLTTLTWVTSAIQCMPCLWVYLKVKNVRVVSHRTFTSSYIELLLLRLYSTTNY